MTTSFSAQLRVLLCPYCGAPCETSLAGGATPCRYCGAHAEVAQRDESLDRVLRPDRPPLSEGERIARLRTQTGKALLPPGNIQHLFQEGALAPWRLQEALGVWQQARQRSQSGDIDAAEAVYYLAMGLSSVYGEANDTPRQRALLESSLEALRLPRHRQAIRCILARLACRSGDGAAGEHWLAPCDPASDDLEIDTPYRFARAVLCTAGGDFGRVITLLGRIPDEVPLLDAMVTACAVFRANALERSGDVAGGAEMLRHFMSKGPADSDRVDKAFGYWAPLGLCPKSREIAREARRGDKARAAARGSGAGVGLILFVVGGGLSVVAIVVLFVGMFAASSAKTTVRRNGRTVEVPVAASYSLLGAIPGLAMLLPGGILLTVGYFLRRAGARARRLALSGVPATALVEGVRPTGVAINNVPQMAFDLLVQRPDGTAPYRVVVKKVGGFGIVPGANLRVLVDPQKPEDVLLDDG